MSERKPKIVKKRDLPPKEKTLREMFCEIKGDALSLAGRIDKILESGVLEKEGEFSY